MKVVVKAKEVWEMRMELVTSSISIVPFNEPPNNEVTGISMEIGEARAYRSRARARTHSITMAHKRNEWWVTARVYGIRRADGSGCVYQCA